jgi:ABC-type Fe3+-hydroxamate transport system substrate-binding protein
MRFFSYSILILSLCWPSPILAQEDNFPRTVTDATGAAVIIPARPQVVATTTDDPILARLLSAEHIRRITPETPDWTGVGLLVIPAGTAAAYPALVEAAAGAGVPIFQTALITSLTDWRAAVTQLGRATGRDQPAAQMLAHLDRRLADLQRRAQGRPAPRVLVLTPEGYTFGQGTLITDLIMAAGGINRAAEAGYGDFRQIADDDLRAFAPDVILLSPAWADRAAFLSNPAYTDVPAVQRGRVYRLPFSPTAPPDPAAAAWALAIMLYPPSPRF